MLRYDLQHGSKDISSIEKMAQLRGVSSPSFIEEKQELDVSLVLYYSSFRELSTTRVYIGMDGYPGPIPWGSIYTYATSYLGLFDYNLDRFVQFIRAMDDEFLEFMVKKKGKNNHVDEKLSKGDGQISPKRRARFG